LVLSAAAATVDEMHDRTRRTAIADHIVYSPALQQQQQQQQQQHLHD